MTQPSSVLIVTGHPEVREIIEASVQESRPDLWVVYASNVEEARVSLPSLRPRVVFLDGTLPGASQLLREACRGPWRSSTQFCLLEGEPAGPGLSGLASGDRSLWGHQAASIVEDLPTWATPATA